MRRRRHAHEDIRHDADAEDMVQYGAWPPSNGLGLQPSTMVLAHNGAGLRPSIMVHGACGAWPAALHHTWFMVRTSTMCDPGQGSMREHGAISALADSCKHTEK